MAKQTEQAGKDPGPSAAEAPTHARPKHGGGTYRVLFAGQPSWEGAASSKEDAIKEAAKALGVLSWETPPAVEEMPG